jgi:hypothetical protein
MTEMDALHYFSMPEIEGRAENRPARRSEQVGSD